jgi:adenylyl- and sulfurtransferase ThiI
LDDKKNEIIELEKEIKKYEFLNDEMDKTCGNLIKENKKLKIQLITNMNNNNN